VLRVSLWCNLVVVRLQDILQLRTGLVYSGGCRCIYGSLRFLVTSTCPSCSVWARRCTGCSCWRALRLNQVTHFLRVQAIRCTLCEIAVGMWVVVVCMLPCMTCANWC
jgi:hypothetical protein